MKIVFVITGLATGGAENMLLRLLERMDRSAFSCHVISLTGIGEIGPRISALGIPVEAFGISAPASCLIGFFRLVKRLFEIKPTVVHTWLYHADLLGGLAAKIVGVPGIIWCVRSSNFLQSDTKWPTRLMLSLCANVSSWLPTVVLYNSQRGREYHKKLGYREKCNIVISNGIDTDLFKPDEHARLDVRRELGIPTTTPLIGLIGRYHSLKNHEGFIQAAIQTHHVMPEVHFLLAGKDVDKENKILYAMIEKSGLSTCFHLLGSRCDIPRITAALDLATLTSWSEAFPNVLIEAMSCGVPCVSTDAGDSALILGEGGWVVPVGDMAGVATHWMNFFRLDFDERRRHGERARHCVRERFDIDVVVRRYEELYRSVAAGRFECLR